MLESFAAARVFFVDKSGPEITLKNPIFFKNLIEHP